MGEAMKGQPAISGEDGGAQRDVAPDGGASRVPAAPAGRRLHDRSLADSAGRPWRGRELSPQPFAGDDGRAPEALRVALDAFAAGRGGPVEVVDAIRDARLLIPLVARLGEAGESPAGAIVDKRADLSIISVAAPDGRRALPVFSSVAALAAWGPQARPVPVEARRAALAALEDGSRLLILDPGSPSEFALRAPAVRAIAAGTSWTLPWQDAEVLDAIAAPLAELAGIREIDVAPGAVPGSLEGPEVLVAVGVEAGIDRAALGRELERAWSGSPVLAERIDALAVSIVGVDAHDDPAAGPDPASPARPGAGSPARQSRPTPRGGGGEPRPTGMMDRGRAPRPRSARRGLLGRLWKGSRDA